MRLAAGSPVGKKRDHRGRSEIAAPVAVTRLGDWWPRRFWGRPTIQTPDSTSRPELGACGIKSRPTGVEGEAKHARLQIRP